MTWLLLTIVFTILLSPNARRSIIDACIFKHPFFAQSLIVTPGSDHFPIFTSIGSSFPKKKNILVYKLKINKKDIILLRHNLCETFAKLKTLISDNIATAYQHFEHHIKQHVYSLFPPGRPIRLPRNGISNAIFFHLFLVGMTNANRRLMGEERLRASTLDVLLLLTTLPTCVYELF